MTFLYVSLLFDLLHNVSIKVEMKLKKIKRESRRVGGKEAGWGGEKEQVRALTF